VTDTIWTREVLTRLRAQYPRIPADEIEALLALWCRVLEPEVDDRPDLRADVEAQVRTTLHALTTSLPRQRLAVEPERAGATAG
jgi:hypothetical protein